MGADVNTGYEGLLYNMWHTRLKFQMGYYGNVNGIWLKLSYE